MLHIQHALEAAREALTSPTRLVVKFDDQGMVRADHSPYAAELTAIDAALLEWGLLHAGLKALILNQRDPQCQAGCAQPSRDALPGAEVQREGADHG